MDAKCYVSEFIGTFALVFIGAGAVLVNSLSGGAVGLVGIALAHGLVLMTMIYALGSISGGHFNPAVTISLASQRRIGGRKAAGYVASQLLGAAAAGLMLLFIFPSATSAQLYGWPATLNVGTGIALEAVLTFFLVTAVYGVAVNPAAAKGVFGFAIGLVLTFDILMGGTVTGAAMNPARAFGPALASGIWGPQLIYWLGPIIGGLAAGIVYEYLLSGGKGAGEAAEKKPKGKKGG